VSLPEAPPTSLTADAPFWPRFHGPKGDNLSPETGLLKEWPGGGPKLLWKTAGIGHGYSSVTLAGGLIFTAGNIGEQSVVTALDLEGKIRWQSPCGEAWTPSDKYPGTRGTPTFDNGHLYFESPLGELVCLKAESGQKVWGLNILEQFDADNIRWALAESVLIDGDRVICCPGGRKGSVVALDKRTGSTVWASEYSGEPISYASPSLAECQGLRIVLTMSANAFLGVDADSGTLLWRFPHKTDWDINALMPIYHDGRVFISSGYRSGSVLLKISVSGRSASVEPVWESKDLDNHHGGVILLNGFLYGAAHSNNRGRWVCLEWESGKQIYAEKGVGKGSLTYGDGLLYTLSERRAVGLVAAKPETHRVVSQFTLPSGGEGPSWAHPVVCGGRLYLRHGETLFAYELRPGDASVNQH